MTIRARACRAARSCANLIRTPMWRRGESMRHIETCALRHCRRGVRCAPASRRAGARSRIRRQPARPAGARTTSAKSTPSSRRSTIATRTRATASARSPSTTPAARSHGATAGLGSRLGLDGEIAQDTALKACYAHGNELRDRPLAVQLLASAQRKAPAVGRGFSWLQREG